MIYLYPNPHAGYYPGARAIAMKVIFRKSDGRVPGAQVLGDDLVDKRISALAMPLTHWDAAGKGFLLDVREPTEPAWRACPTRSTSRSGSSGRASTSSPGTRDPRRLPLGTTGR